MATKRDSARNIAKVFWGEKKKRYIQQYTVLTMNQRVFKVSQSFVGQSENFNRSVLVHKRGYLYDSFHTETFEIKNGF